MKSIFDLCYSEVANQCLDIHLPDSAQACPLFIYFHGGGLEAGDKKDQEPIFRYLTDHGIAVVSANYRLYPTAHYPDFLCDAAQAVAWALEHIKEYADVTKIYVGGSSAGGYISQMLCFDKQWLGQVGLSPLQMDGFVLDAGQPTCHYNVLRERGLNQLRVVVDEAAPLYHIGTDEKYAPMLIIVSDNDMENRYEQTMLLISALKHFGHVDNVEYKVMHGTHCAYVFDNDAEGNNVFATIVREYIQGK